MVCNTTELLVRESQLPAGTIVPVATRSIIFPGTIVFEFNSIQISMEKIQNSEFFKSVYYIFLTLELPKNDIKKIFKEVQLSL